MEKIIYLGWLIIFLPALVFAQEKVEAPAWNVGEKWAFTGDGSIEVVKADESGYILKFSDGKCIFESQGCNTILFQKSTQNRINAVEGGKLKKYTMGLSRILDFPLSTTAKLKFLKLLSLRVFFFYETYRQYHCAAYDIGSVRGLPWPSEMGEGGRRRPVCGLAAESAREFFLKRSRRRRRK
jgi:hypothetical protein